MLLPYWISQTTRLSVNAEKGQVTNSQTAWVKATPSTLCIQKQWDLGRLRGPRQTLWNYSFPPTSSDRSASLCWRLKLSAYCKYTFLLKPSLSLTKDWAKKNLMQILIRVLLRRWGKVHLSSCSLFLTVKLATKHSHQPQKKDKKKQETSLSQNLNVSLSCHIAEEWFHFE